MHGATICESSSLGGSSVASSNGSATQRKVASRAAQLPPLPVAGSLVIAPWHSMSSAMSDYELETERL